MITKNQIQKLVKLFTTFSAHLSIFLIVNAVLWAVWLLILNRPFDFTSWPLYVSSSWLAILVIHFLVTYYKFRVGEKE
jgi:lysylphosphatidylglycerol synthetase-like protein (DUF2156 family)